MFLNDFINYELGIPAAIGYMIGNHYGSKNAIKKGGGSDWRISQYSRGPVNYPSNKLLFNQFSNSKNYISNENLPKAAVPMNEISEPPFPNKHFSLPNSSAPF